jgi:Fur family ferric uptake transcriptional regulator
MNADEMLARGDLAATPRRRRVVAALQAAARPVTPLELLETETLREGLNRVTLYRILDLLVEHGVATRHNAGERAFRYCLRDGPSGHAHFTCVRCGVTQCLDSAPLSAGLDEMIARLPMRVETVELRFGGVCEVCLGN